MKSLSELINTTDSGMPIVNQWIAEASHTVAVLPSDPHSANDELYKAQVTTRSPMGSVIYHTGGILVDHGWIRILGSGHPKFNRGMMEWNLGKSYDANGNQFHFLLVADDVIGGFFALNGGGLSPDNIGKIFYFAQDNLTWESTDLGYSEFLIFCFSGDLSKFYQGFRWNNWEDDVGDLDGNTCFGFYPFLWTVEGKDISRTSRKPIPISEIWGLSMDIKNQLDNRK